MSARNPHANTTETCYGNSRTEPRYQRGPIPNQAMPLEGNRHD